MALKIKFQAVAWQIKTMAKGKITVTLSLGENETQNISELLSHKHAGIGLNIIASPVELPKVDDAKKRKDNPGRKTKPQRRRWKPDKG